MAFKSEYVKSWWLKFTGKDDPDRAFFKIMFNLDQFVEEASEYVADNGYVYLYVMADKESYNNRNNKNATIKRPFVVVNQKAKWTANNKIKQKLWAIKNKNKNNENET